MSLLPAETLRILIVEDSEDDAELLLQELRRGRYETTSLRVDTAEAMAAALAEHTWDLVVSDHSVLQCDSLVALNVLQASGLDIPFIIVSGTIGEERAVQVMKAGASDYLTKGKLARLLPVIARELADARERRGRRAAEQALRDREQQVVLELAAAHEATLEGWARALDLRDHETEGHSRRVTDLAVKLARRMGVSEADCVHVRRGALLHDIGKVGIPDHILLKPGALTPAEWDIMRRHPEYAWNLLSSIDYLRPALDIPYCHHEKWDGTGYPRGLEGEAIPLAARIFAVVDIWDAVRSRRPYREAWTDQEARDYLADISGTHLDPSVTRVFLEMEAAMARAARALGGEADAHRRETVLVIDDHAENTELLRRWIAADGYDVIGVTSADAAMSLVVDRRPHLILLDLTLPEPDSLSLCRRLKQLPAAASIPVILMGGDSPTVVEEHAQRMGADDYVTKPVDAYELRVRIRRQIDESRPTPRA